MSVPRQELETRLAAFAASNSLTVAYEGRHFDKPSTAFLECTIVGRNTKNVTTDGERKRERGIFQVNVWYPTGTPTSGAGTVEAIAESIIATFPVVPKVGNVSVEETPNQGSIITDVAGWLVLPVTISYRYES